MDSETLIQITEIKEKILQIKADKKLYKVIPMIVLGDEDSGEKEFYVTYMRDSSFPQFSKFMIVSVGGYI